MSVKNLPPIGRPSKYGLSLKHLGWREYARRRYQMKVGHLTKPRWTGISAKAVGKAVWTKLWREMKKRKTLSGMKPG